MISTDTLQQKIQQIEKPTRIALSRRFPKVLPLIYFSRCFLVSLKNTLNLQISKNFGINFYPYIIARHQSLLYRHLGDSDPILQKNKVTNLKIASQKLNGLTISPGKTFSFWQSVGKPTERKGYIEGMLLSNGEVKTGIGGGLCQMSNLLFWLFLHTPIQVTERYHHSKDVFPDSSRTLPFGSGATILYNFVDLKIKNISSQPLQLKIWLTDKHLKGQILSPKPTETKFHLFEKNHIFVKKYKQFYRYNEIFRQEKLKGEVIKTEKVTTNFAPVYYKITKKYIKDHRFALIDLSRRDIS